MNDFFDKGFFANQHQQEFPDTESRRELVGKLKEFYEASERISAISRQLAEAKDGLGIQAEAFDQLRDQVSRIRWLSESTSELEDHAAAIEAAAKKIIDAVEDDNWKTWHLHQEALDLVTTCNTTLESLAAKWGMNTFTEPIHESAE